MKRLLFICMIFSLGAILFSSSAYATASSAIDAIVQKMSNGNTKEAVHQYLYFDGIRFWMILASLFIASGVISLAGEIASSFGGSKLGGGVGDASSKLTTTFAKGAVGLTGKAGHHTKGLATAGIAGLGAKLAQNRLTKSAGAKDFIDEQTKRTVPSKSEDPSEKIKNPPKQGDDSPKDNRTNPSKQNETPQKDNETNSQQRDASPKSDETNPSESAQANGAKNSDTASNNNTENTSSLATDNTSAGGDVGGGLGGDVGGSLGGDVGGAS